MANITPGSQYTIQAGDTLSAIAQQAYGDSNQWQKVYEANKESIGSDPNALRPGTILTIPLLPPTPGSKYTVRAGDTLSSIAQQAYGDSNQWQKIYTANTQVIGNNPNVLHPGDVLAIPALTPSQPKTCRVTASQGINIRSAPNSQSSIVANYTHGTELNFVEVVTGENVAGNAHWGHSQQGNYFWLGATDHPNG